MKALVIKELKVVFCSYHAVFFSLILLSVSGLMLWVVPGDYNIIDNGWVSLSNFFSLLPNLLVILIPALTMHTFSQEKRTGTLDTLRIRPVNMLSVYFAKFFAIILLVFIVLLTTTIYIYTLSELSSVDESVDIYALTISYISALLLASIFTLIGITISSFSKNQIVALIISIFACIFCFYGFQLIASLIISGKYQLFFSSLGLYSHYETMQKGIIQLSDVVVFINYALFSILPFCFKNTPINKRILFILSFIIVILNVSNIFLPNTKYDFTSDKRYTLSPITIELLKQINSQNFNIKVNIFLDGDLNSSFQNLKNSTSDILSTFNKYAENTITIEYNNPYKLHNNVEQMYTAMTNLRMSGIMVNETDREGKMSRKVIYPYAQVISEQDTLVIDLLKNISGNTVNENINASIEMLEYEFVDAIRLLTQPLNKTIAFIDGHGELSRTNLYDAEELLAKYYTINRGEIGNQADILNNFDAIIIAGPISPFSETEKYIIDQYIMQGGRVMWIVDGAVFSHNQLAVTGQSPSMKNELNLDDMLFSYGVRINSDFVQDSQCLPIYVMQDSPSGSSTSMEIPCYYMPILLPSINHSITHNIKDIMSRFASSISFVNTSDSIQKEILLTTSLHSHIVKAPETIDLKTDHIQNSNNYFDQSFIPVAVSLQGKFTSAFNNRPSVNGISLPPNYLFKSQSSIGKMVIISSSSIITNGVEGDSNNTQIIPMGYDKVTKKLYGNQQLIVNAVNWLTDDTGLMELRNKRQIIRTIDKQKAYQNRNFYALLNIIAPLLIVVIIFSSVNLYRKYEYEK